MPAAMRPVNATRRMAAIGRKQNGCSWEGKLTVRLEEVGAAMRTLAADPARVHVRQTDFKST